MQTFPHLKEEVFELCEEIEIHEPSVDHDAGCGLPESLNSRQSSVGTRAPIAGHNQQVGKVSHPVVVGITSIRTAPSRQQHLEVVEIDGVVFVEVAATAIKAQPAIEVDEPVCVGTGIHVEVAKPRAGTAKDRPVISNIAE